jgi:hypothetical protein
MKIRKKRSAGLRPQEYEHRIGCAIESLAAVAAGTQVLVAYLSAQQGPEWRDQQPKVVKVRKEFQRARTWLKAIDRHD